MVERLGNWAGGGGVKTARRKHERETEASQDQAMQGLIIHF